MGEEQKTEKRSAATTELISLRNPWEFGVCLSVTLINIAAFEVARFLNSEHNTSRERGYNGRQWT